MYVVLAKQDPALGELYLQNNDLAGSGPAGPPETAQLFRVSLKKVSVRTYSEYYLVLNPLLLEGDWEGWYPREVSLYIK